ncbi:hypothetical protein BCV70DRAFT_218966 [Testicularia cyperi]|uniref:Uncharacterized protein n=1 Tax=Testicularia cyperi TaxID=1882483 RepID=A0A317XJV9_9BASI|nr:hypothetical protein BCV70DRAFT_218966 [Testicularia cyperi]
MSTPSGRSATVTGLSGRVQALKFMQRGGAASPSTTPGRASPSHSLPSSPSTPARQLQIGTASLSGAASPVESRTASPAPALPGAAEDEQWSLSPAKIAQLRAHANKSASNSTPAAISVSSAHIYHEAGFDAWLIERQKSESDSSASRLSTSGHRQTFGSLDKKDREPSKKRTRSEEDQDPNTEPDFDFEESFDEDEDKDEVDAESSKRKKSGSGKTNGKQGFVKPGTLGKGRLEQSPSGAKKNKTQSRSSKSKNEDKVVYARKKGGKKGISGGK